MDEAYSHMVLPDQDPGSEQTISSTTPSGTLPYIQGKKPSPPSTRDQLPDPPAFATPLPMPGSGPPLVTDEILRSLPTKTDLILINRTESRDQEGNKGYWGVVAPPPCCTGSWRGGDEGRGGTGSGGREPLQQTRGPAPGTLSPDGGAGELG